MAGGKGSGWGGRGGWKMPVPGTLIYAGEPVPESVPNTKAVSNELAHKNISRGFDVSFSTGDYNYIARQTIYHRGKQIKGIPHEYILNDEYVNQLLEAFKNLGEREIQKCGTTEDVVKTEKLVLSALEYVSGEIEVVKNKYQKENDIEAVTAKRGAIAIERIKGFNVGGKDSEKKQ